ncbi:MAG: sterol desaturase family protein [Flavobacteriales bacterium]
MILWYILITLGTFLLMEGVTWFTHKYIMHGFLWYLHKDHHQPTKSALEKNDAFFIIFATPSILLFYFGTLPTINYKFFIGLGILLYGLAYFLIHDVLIHKRFNWFNTTKSKYFNGLKRGHRMHHKHINKEKGECFGMLYVASKYFKTKRL